MRLFIAVNFKDEIKNRLFDTANRLKDQSVKGNFTRRENFHLTLIFIGETSRLNEIKAAIGHINAQAFRLTLSGLGTFRRKGSAVYWMGVEKNGALTAVHQQLYGALTDAGFMLEDREFNAHLTLGREVVMRENFDFKAFAESIAPMPVQINKISLMSSERAGGILTYREIYTKELH